MFEVRTLPGQEPYTPAEIATLYGLVHDAALGDPGEADESVLCRECGAPLVVQPTGAIEPVHVFCDICGGTEHPADLTPDWNGETGSHRTCELLARAKQRAKEANR